MTYEKIGFQTTSTVVKIKIYILIHWNFYYIFKSVWTYQEQVINYNRLVASTFSDDWQNFLKERDKACWILIRTTLSGFSAFIQSFSNCSAYVLLCRSFSLAFCMRRFLYSNRSFHSSSSASECAWLHLSPNLQVPSPKYLQGHIRKVTDENWVARNRKLNCIEF